MGKEHKASIDGDQWAQCVREHGWLWDVATGKRSGEPVTLILAHGAGAPMDSAFMNDMAARLAGHGVNVLRFEFPYMAQRRLDGGKRPPNPAPKLLEAWREVYDIAAQHDVRIAPQADAMLQAARAKEVAELLPVEHLPPAPTAVVKPAAAKDIGHDGIDPALRDE